MPQAGGIQTATVLVCCLAVARPQQLYFYAAVLWFWGLFNVVSGTGGIVNMLLYFSGCAFAYKQGFFRRGRKGKLIGCVLALFAAVLSLWRLGTAYMAQSLLECFSVFFLLGGAALLFWEELGRAREHNSESLLRLTEPEFTPEDAEILRKILAAEKYESIAAESGVSVSTLKKQVKKLFGKLRVADRATFVSRYARCAVTVD
ncbi:MAG: response regulator transcription factor [Treponematales bacterium]